jgi:hypothetical protein
MLPDEWQAELDDFRDKLLAHGNTSLRRKAGLEG